jgi:hypothetical protein
MVSFMKRSMRLTGALVFGATEAVLELTPQEVGVLALEVTLLLESMVVAVTIQAADGARIELALNEAHKWGEAKRVSDRHVRYALGRNQIEYLHATLLRAYRDEKAPVNHVHIEAHSEGAGFDLTVLFKVYASPMSPNEADAAIR